MAVIAVAFAIFLLLCGVALVVYAAGHVLGQVVAILIFCAIAKWLYDYITEQK